MLDRKDFRADVTYSIDSQPRTAADATYKIHLVKSDDPIEAIRQTRQELAGLENRDAPPGSMPL